jgi:hypothetical protein
MCTLQRMRLSLPTCLLLLASLTASASTKDESSKRIEKLLSAGKAWMRDTTQMRSIVIEQLDPADCTSGSRALTQYVARVARNEELAGKLQVLAKGATKEENKLAWQRMMKELNPEMEVLRKRAAARQATMKQFGASCPTESKAIQEALKKHSGTLEKMD